GLAATLQMPESRLRVLCPAVGGGFGPKMHLYPEDVAVADLARRLGRPVRWLEDRRENLLAAAHARGCVCRVVGGARSDGTIVAIRTRLVSDAGAYSVFPVTVALEPMTAVGIVPGPYRFQAYAYEAYAVATNKSPLGAYRGVGMAFGTLVRERIVDMIARRTGLDPAEARRRTFIEGKDLPFRTGSGLVVDRGDSADAFERALAAGDYDKLRAEPRRTAEGKYRGIGIAAYTEFTGMGASTFRRRGMTMVSGH